VIPLAYFYHLTNHIIPTNHVIEKQYGMILEISINYKNIVLYKIDLKLILKLFFNNIWYLDYEKRNC